MIRTRWKLAALMIAATWSVSGGQLPAQEPTAVYDLRPASEVLAIQPIAYEEPACATDAACGDACGGAGACTDDICGDCGTSDLCGGCGSLADCCSSDHLAGIFKHSEPCFNDFISPMTNPVFFEDPRTLTEARAIYIHHKVPAEAGGGQIDLFAVQLRAALTDRLSLIASKDGYATSSNPLIDDGWADLNLGLKYNILRDPVNQQIVSVGAWYELPIGSTRTLQAQGDGEFHLFVSGLTELAENWHLVSGSGFRLPANRNQGSQMWYWSNHVDYEVAEGLYGLVECNWFHWMGSGQGGLPGVEGGDLFNLGSTNVGGNDIVTGAVGMKYKPQQNVELGIAWELPLSDRRDVMHDRLTIDAIFRY